MTNKQMFYNSHFEAFVAFAEAQPENRTIDHSGWCNCAIGNYHKEATSNPPRNPDDVDGDKGYIDLLHDQSPLLEELENDHGYIHEALNQGQVPNRDSHHFSIDTYGELAKFMEEYSGMEFDEDAFDDL